LTRHVRILAAAGLVAALALTSSPFASGMIASTSDVHHWLWDARQSVVDTPSEAAEVARRNDLVVGQEHGYGKWLDTMHAAHPGVAVIAYHSGVSAKDTKLDWIRANHPEWLLRDRSGRLLRDSGGAYLINPANPAARAWHVSIERALAAGKWDGVYLDSLGTYGLESFGGTPVDPSTGKLFTRATWLAATRTLAIQVDRAIAKPVIGNGLRDGVTYFGGNKALLDGLQAGVFEACFRGATLPLDRYPSTDAWLAQVNAIRDVQSKGKYAICMVKAWGRGTAAQAGQWHDFALASFLIAAGNSSYFSFSGSTADTALNKWTVHDTGIGKATAPASQSGGVYLRQYASGIAVVNPTPAAQAVSLGKTYTTPSGTRVSRLTLPAHAGMVLTS
jgi:hypothetical protein